jgi:hypothetical protein
MIKEVPDTVVCGYTKEARKRVKSKSLDRNLSRCAAYGTEMRD